MNPFATYDCLAIGEKLQPVLSNFSLSEINLFSYLSCLLSVYKDNPVSEWGYRYAGTKISAPYSEDIIKAASSLKQVGLISEDSGYFKVTDEGKQTYLALKDFSQHRRREIFIDGACSCILALPLGVIRDSLSKEPELSYSAKTKNTRFLLADGPGLDTLYEDFRILSKTLGVEVQDLMVPAVIWLTYLSTAKIM